MTIKDWPPAARPREKLLREGAETLSDAELVAVLLRSGRRGFDAVLLGEQMLRACGGVRGLLELDPARFSALAGCGPATYAVFRAARELNRRYLYSALARGEPLTDPTLASSYVVAAMKAYQREVFACVFLDTRHRVITVREIFFGSIDSATVHPREIVKACLELNAAAVILVHNHPSGVAEPSAADGHITRRIAEAAALVDVRILDHLIVGEREAVSMAARGLL